MKLTTFEDHGLAANLRYSPASFTVGNSGDLGSCTMQVVYEMLVKAKLPCRFEDQEICIGGLATWQARIYEKYGVFAGVELLENGWVFTPSPSNVRFPSRLAAYSFRNVGGEVNRAAFKQFIRIMMQCGVDFYGLGEVPCPSFAGTTKTVLDIPPKPQDLQTWKIDDEMKFLSEAKMKALGIPEKFLIVEPETAAFPVQTTRTRSDKSEYMKELQQENVIERDTRHGIASFNVKKNYTKAAVQSDLQSTYPDLVTEPMLLSETTSMLSVKAENWGADLVFEKGSPSSYISYLNRVYLLDRNGDVFRNIDPNLDFCGSRLEAYWRECVGKNDNDSFLDFIQDLTSFGVDFYGAGEVPCPVLNSTITGRTNCADPNPQWIPRQDKENKMQNTNMNDKTTSTSLAPQTLSFQCLRAWEGSGHALRATTNLYYTTKNKQWYQSQDSDGAGAWKRTEFKSIVDDLRRFAYSDSVSLQDRAIRELNSLLPFLVRSGTYKNEDVQGSLPRLLDLARSLGIEEGRNVQRPPTDLSGARKPCSEISPAPKQPYESIEQMLAKIGACPVCGTTDSCHRSTCENRLVDWSPGHVTRAAELPCAVAPAKKPSRFKIRTPQEKMQQQISKGTYNAPFESVLDRRGTPASCLKDTPTFAFQSQINSAPVVSLEDITDLVGSDE